MNIKAITGEDGFVSLDINKVVAVCAFCGNHDNDNAVIEFNFRDKKIYYLCSSCKKMNEIIFGKGELPPLPKTSIKR